MFGVQVGCVCNNAQLRGDQIIGHPTEGAMLALAHRLNLFGLRDQFVRIEERTFSSEQKWMGVLVRPRTRQVTDVIHYLPLYPSLFDTYMYIYIYACIFHSVIHIHVFTSLPSTCTFLPPSLPSSLPSP